MTDTTDSMPLALLQRAVQERSARAVRALLDEGGQALLDTESQASTTVDGLVTLAVHHGRPDVLALLLERGGDPNQLSELSSSPRHELHPPLHRAVLREDLGLMDVLLADARLDVNRSVRGWSALHRAASVGADPVVQRLLDAGAEPDRVDLRFPRVGRPVERACEAGALDVVERLLDQAKDPVEWINRASTLDAGPSLLLQSAWYGHAALVQALLQRGANPAIRDDQARTTLERTLWQIQVGLVPSGGAAAGVLDVLLDAERGALASAMDGLPPLPAPPLRPRL